MSKTLTAIHRRIRELAKKSSVVFDISQLRSKIVAKRRPPTNRVVFDAMMNGPKYVLVQTRMTPDQLLTTPDGLEKIARLIAPVAWAEFDAAPPGSKPGTKSLANCDIAEIVSSQKAATRLAAYVLLHTEPEIGQTTPK